MSRRKAFTLVELLIVIGIIALLISILLPALNRAREQANMVKCQSNMRTLMLCVGMYESDYKGQVPFCNWDDNVDVTTNYGYGWLFAKITFRHGWGPGIDGAWGANPPPMGVKTGVLWPYCHEFGIYHCPLDYKYQLHTERMTSYLMDGSQCGFGAVGASANNTQNIPGCKIGQIRHPAESVLFWEAVEQSYANQGAITGAIWNDGSSRPNEELMANRHFKGGNVACVDGHVEFWDTDTWNFYAKDRVHFNRLWWSPFTRNGHG